MDPARTHPLAGVPSGSQRLDRLRDLCLPVDDNLLGRHRICWGMEGLLLVHLGGAQIQAQPLYLLRLHLQGSATARTCQVLRRTP